MTNQHDEMLELSALYGVGLVPADQCAAVAAHIEQCSECRAEYENGRLAAFALATSASQTPAAALRARILAKVAPAKAPPIRMPWERWAWVAAAAAAVMIVFIAVWNGANVPQTQVAAWAVACVAEPCTSRGRVVSVSATQMSLEAHGLKPLATGKVYQAWYIPKGRKPVPAPTFVPSPTGDAKVAIPAGAHNGMVVAVTVEPQGGSKQPTTKPFMVATISCLENERGPKVPFAPSCRAPLPS